MRAVNSFGGGVVAGLIQSLMDLGETAAHPRRAIARAVDAFLHPDQGFARALGLPPPGEEHLATGELGAEQPVLHFEER